MTTINIDTIETRKRYPAMLLIGAVLLFLFLPSLSQAISVEARLSPQTFSTNQPARLTITVTDTRSAEIALPDVEGLAFHERGTSKQFQMINGKTSSTVTYTYLVQGLAPGSYTIPPITVSASGTKTETKSISCTVKDSPLRTSSPGNSSASDSIVKDGMGKIAFLKLIPDKTEGYVGEIIPARIEAYFNQRARVRITSLPAMKSDGVLIDPLKDEPAQRIETVNGIDYNVISWDTALTGIKEGTYDLEMGLDTTVQVQAQRQRRLPQGFEDDFFNDRFFNNFFNQYETRPIRVVGTPVKMKIHDLPAEGKPENFSGAVGQFSFSLEVSPLSIGLGDPITLKMSIKGSGNFDNVKAPSLTSEEGLKSYSPSASFTEGGGSHRGEKIFEQAVVVTNSGLSRIPPVTFSYFDPEKEQYRTLFSDPVPVTVKSPPIPDTGPPPKASPAPGKSNTTAVNQARFPMLAPVKLTMDRQVSRIQPIFLRPSFYICAIIILIAICGVTGLRIRNHHLLRNPELVRQKMIERKRGTVLKQLTEGKELDDRQYLLNTQEGIRKLLGLLWRTEAASLTTADIALRLGPDHPITRLFTWADRSSYGGHTFSAEEKRLLHESIINSIKELS